MGDAAVGVSLSLVSPAEDKPHARILQALQLEQSPTNRMETWDLEGRLLRSAVQRVNLATQIVKWSTKDRQTQQDNSWWNKMAKEADMELDDRLLEEMRDDDGPKANQSRRHIESAKTRLQQLLAEPLSASGARSGRRGPRR